MSTREMDTTGVRVIRRGRVGRTPPIPAHETWACAHCGAAYRLTGPDAPAPNRTLQDEGWWFASTYPQCRRWNWAVVYDRGPQMWRLTHRIYHRVWLMGTVLVAAALAPDLSVWVLGPERGAYVVAGLVAALLLAFQLVDSR